MLIFLINFMIASEIKSMTRTKRKIGDYFDCPTHKTKTKTQTKTETKTKKGSNFLH